MASKARSTSNRRDRKKAIPSASPSELATLLAHQRGRGGKAAQRDELFRSVLDSLSEAILITDPDDRILYANALAVEMSGREREELIGQVAYDTLATREEREKMKRRNRRRMSGKSETYELEQRRPDGSRHWVSIKATPFRNGEGRVIGTIGASTCIDDLRRLTEQNEYLREELGAQFNRCHIIGRSPGLRKVLEQIEMVAPTQATTLITGESGVGKELVARAIHDLSARADKPLVRVNCASIPKELFESEFFGHARGAFTGAVRERMGRFELAHGGALFLDEIGEIPLDLQGKLLRVLQEGQFERVGENRTRKVDVRLIAATNRDLLAESREGRFRSDLYYRLSVFPIEIPPLRERPEDIAPLTAHFVQDSATRLGVAPPALPAAQLEILENYEWPGNVRELQNVIERSIILSRERPLQFRLENAHENKDGGDIAPTAGMASIKQDLTLADLKRMERELIQHALEECRWRIYGDLGAAALLRIKPTTLVSRMKKFGVKRPGS